MQIDDGRLALGLIPDKEGMDGVYAWGCEARETESFGDYANKVKKSTFEIINKMNPENNVSPEYSDLLYYNLTWN